MKKTAPDGAVSGMPAIRETGPGKNLQAITVSTSYCNLLNLHELVGRIRRSRRIRHKQRARCLRPTAFYTWTFNYEKQAADPQPAGFCTCLCLAATNRRHHLSDLSLIAK
ncbi:hypothetical protein E3B71_16350 [Escherichia coli]|nr:hypothetical protein BE948_06910 [Escherichia coli]MBW9778038.1 hypothetical protein [Escherichia coli]MCE4151427.1 hypothetical protein [Escherichia coli]PSF89903.1 hypothetical protein C6964_21845 [Escherichia coli]QEE89926.1 hypothetical protein E3B71_16350 [Escherichia coli]